MKSIVLSQAEKDCLLPVYTTSSNTESNLYILKDDILIKELHHGLAKKRESLISYLGDYTNPNCVLPKEKYYDNSRIFKGYTMDYLRNYRVLGHVIISGNTLFEERKNLAIRVNDIVRGLDKDDIAYFDVHEDNFMIDSNNQIKLIDMDSVHVKSIPSDDSYSVDERYSHYYTALLCTSLLYGVKEYDFYKNSNDIYTELSSMLSSKQKQLLNFIRNKNHGIFYLDDYFDDFTEEFISDTSDTVLKLIENSKR